MNKHPKGQLRSLLVVAAAALVAVAAAPSQVVYAPAPSEVWVEGTSTLHDWRVESEKIQGEVRVSPEFLLASEAPESETPAARVRIPVQGLESGKAKMDTLMYEALDAEKHPFITYELDEIRRVGENDAGVDLETRGRLTVAGETRPLTMRVTAKLLDGGSLLVEGSTPLRMTDFGIEPPKAMLGTIKTADEVRVGFRWTLLPETAAGKS